MKMIYLPLDGEGCCEVMVCSHSFLNSPHENYEMWLFIFQESVCFFSNLSFPSEVKESC